jgi:hypothetical protein
MKTQALAATALVLAAAVQPAHAFIFTLNPVTNTTPNFAGPIFINGTVTVAPSETFYTPTVMSSVALPFLGFTAGFNGNGQTFDAAFLAWNGIGTYTGAIYNNQVSTNNFGYTGGMPVGLYNSNVIGPGGQSAITLNYADANGITRSAVAAYAINVVPTPGAASMLAMTGLMVSRRRR